MLENWINGASAPSLHEGSIAVVNPATEETLMHAPQGGPRDVDRAVACCQAVSSEWAALAPVRRKTLLREVAMRLAAAADTMAAQLTAENGKPLADARGEIDAAVDIIFSYSELAVHVRTGSQAAAIEEISFQHRQPRGVVACIVPWNYPIVAAFGNMLPALAVGNTAVWKPSEHTPITSRRIAETAFSALPPGVVNLIMGDGAHLGEHLVAHPDVDLVAFIGSDGVGRRIGKICGRALKKTILELGGKDAMIVDETVDTGKAAKLAAAAVFANAGQICTSTERIYVHRSVAERFTATLVEEAASICVGDGAAPDVRMGPLISQRQLDKVSGQVEDAVRRGARLLCGGVRLNRPGFFYPPTVITDVPPDSLIMREETFGPIAPVFVFDDFDEAIAKANDSDYGLASIVCTRSSDRALRSIKGIEAGTVKINLTRGRVAGSTAEPFKSSGIGYGAGVEIMLEMTRQKAVQWRADLL